MVESSRACGIARPPAEEDSMPTFTATVALREGATFDATSGSGHSVVLDSPEVTGGGNAGFRPLEMLLVGVGGCAGMVVCGLLRRMGQRVSRYEVAVSGVRAETHPLVFTDVAVEHRLEGPGLDPAAVRQALATSAKLSPVVVMVGNAARLTHTYRVTDTSTGNETCGSLE
jgi:putative redox protein